MKYFDAFTGYGGFTLAIQNQIKNAECIGFSEIDKYAKQVYQFQFPNHKDYGSITEIDETTLPDFDLFTGGFPCQSFSVAGKRGGFDDTRGTLIFDILRICAHKKPKHILLENVKGLLSHDNGRTFSTIIEAIQEIGYGVSWKVLNAKDFGVPQNRERVFILCTRGEPSPEILPIGEDAQVLIERQGKVCPTITSRYYKQGQSDPYIVNEEKVIARKLTPLECERLMGLPDNWTKQGTDGELSDTQRYKLCGNGVVVNCVEVIIKQIFNQHDVPRG